MIATTVIIFGRKWSTFDYQSSAASSLIWLNFHRVANDSHFRRSPVVLVAILVGVSRVYILPILFEVSLVGCIHGSDRSYAGPNWKIAVGLVLLGFLVALVPLRTFIQRRLEVLVRSVSAADDLHVGRQDRID